MNNDLSTIAPGTSIGAVLTRPPLDPLEARILVSHALCLSRVQLITQSERQLDSEEAQAISALFARRIAGEPIAYVVGEREFFGLMFHTTPAVLIPRPETELLVELALQRLPPGAGMLDLGTGSGAIAVAVAQQRPDVKVTATDLSAAALAVATRNAQRHRAQVAFLQSDWYAALGVRQFDLIVSNPPYIVAGDPHLTQGDLRYEPVDALTDHGDGLSALRSIVTGAAAHLRPGGWLLMEHGYDQAPAVRALLNRQGFSEVQSWRDLAAIERVSGGVASAPFSAPVKTGATE
jgi:release factor glutamine methyltransferase